MKTILAIPCYNCEQQIGRVIGELNDGLIQRLAKILIIDNGSTDGTLSGSRKLAAGLNEKFGAGFAVAVKNRKNFGLGGTHKVAFQFGESVGADYVAILHGDNQAASAELAGLIESARSDPDAAAILGARFHPGSRLRGYSPMRTFGNVALNLVCSLLSLRLVFDLGSGLNLFRLKDLADRRYLQFDDGFTFNIDLLLDYLRKNCRIAYFPITWRETDQVSNIRALPVGWEILVKIVKWRIGLPPAAKRRSVHYLWDEVT